MWRLQKVYGEGGQVSGAEKYKWSLYFSTLT